MVIRMILGRSVMIGKDEVTLIIEKGGATTIEKREMMIGTGGEETKIGTTRRGTMKEINTGMIATEKVFNHAGNLLAGVEEDLLLAGVEVEEEVQPEVEVLPDQIAETTETRDSTTEMITRMASKTARTGSIVIMERKATPGNLDPNQGRDQRGHLAFNVAPEVVAEDESQGKGELMALLLGKLALVEVAQAAVAKAHHRPHPH